VRFSRVARAGGVAGHLDGSAGNGRSSNLRRILREVASGDAATRADLSRATGLTRPTVSSLVSELIDLGLIIELGRGVSEGGKRPTLLGIDSRSRCVVAIDVGSRHVVGTLSDLSGQVVSRDSIPDQSLTGEALLGAVVELVERLAGQASAPVLGVGVGTAGLVSPDGVVIEASNLDWHELRLAEVLRDTVGLETWVANGADAAAMAEYRACPADGDLVVVRMGTGVGAGLLLDGRVHAGRHAAAGEIGHLVVEPGGAECRCGNRGCLETLTSVTAILRRTAELAGIDDAAHLPRDLTALRKRAGTGPVDQALTEAGCHLGTVLAHLVAIVDVNRIVLCPDLQGAVDALQIAVQAELENRLLPGHADGVQVRMSTMGPDLVLHGAHALVISGSLGLIGVRNTLDGSSNIAARG
jgi:predicted NBD/HSP70 family sugar kinase